MRVTPILLTVLASLLVSSTGLTQTLGAHPWWARSVVWLGLPFGLAIAWLIRFFGFRYRWRVIGTALFGAAAFIIATLGKSRFAASYAEDVLAGQFWHLGWVATCAFSVAFLTSLLWPDRWTH